MSRTIERHTLEWGGIQISITYEPHWLNLGEKPDGIDPAHLQVESLAPERARLPITETGYRSHFTNAETIAALGGPVAFVEAWLDEESQRPEWQAYHQASRQLALF